MASSIMEGMEELQGFQYNGRYARATWFPVPWKGSMASSIMEGMKKLHDIQYHVRYERQTGMFPISW